jgi:hypothetical protein
VAYPSGRTSAVYGASASAGGVLLSERNVYVNASGEPDVMAAGPLAAVRKGGTTPEGGGKVFVRDNVLVGSLRQEPTAGDAAEWPDAPVRVSPAKLGALAAAQCMVRWAGAAAADTSVTSCSASRD